jgi:hypothetical protein
LSNLDISSFDPKAPPLKTWAFNAIVNSHRPTEAVEFAVLLEYMNDPDAVTIDQLEAEAITHQDLHSPSRWLDEPKNVSQINHKLEACGYIEVPNPDSKDKSKAQSGRWSLWTWQQVPRERVGLVWEKVRSRPRIYARMILDPQAQFDAARALLRELEDASREAMERKTKQKT